MRRPSLDRMRLESRVAGRRRAVSFTLLRGAAAEELGIGRFAENDARFWPRPAQDPADPYDRAAGPVSGHEKVQPRAGKIIDDLKCRRRLVDGGVGGGLELLGE